MYLQQVRLLVMSAICVTGAAWPQTPAQVEYFESKVRPVLMTRCASCHGEKVQMGGIRLTSHDGMHVAGVVIPGDADSSRLIQAVRYTGKIKMPPTGKLPDAEIDALSKWVAEGAIWPETPRENKVPQPAGFWAFQPVKKPPAPSVKNAVWAH